MTTTHNYCKATTKNGSPCRALAVSDSDYCWSHEPRLAETRHEAYRRGGHNRANIVRLRALVPPRLIPVFDLLEEAMTEVHDGTITPQQGQSMASLARAMVSVLTAGELEERVRELERQTHESGSRIGVAQSNRALSSV
jgi:hypothetical protein